MNLPSFETYGDYKSENYGSHCLKFSLDNVTIYFSYRTPIAFHTYEKGLVIRENEWGPTTGKHLNWIDQDHSKRINGAAFEKMLSDEINRKD